MVVLNIFHVLIAIAMVALVLVQRGAGATAGAAFGSGASGTVFGARGAGTFLSKSTWVLASLFCAISLTMAVMVSRQGSSTESNLGVVSTTPAAQQEAEEVPAPPARQGAQGGQQGDLPALRTGEDNTGAAQQPVDDLPAIDSGGGESTAKDQGGTATGTGSDDS